MRSGRLRTRRGLIAARARALGLVPDPHHEAAAALAERGRNAPYPPELDDDADDPARVARELAADTASRAARRASDEGP